MIDLSAELPHVMKSGSYWNEFTKFWIGDTHALVNRNRVLLRQDNARPHTARTTMTKIQELGGIGLLPRPAYSPDLADYHLFRFIAISCVEKISKTLRLEVCVSEFFAWDSRPICLFTPMVIYFLVAVTTRWLSYFLNIPNMAYVIINIAHMELRGLIGK